MEINKFAFFRIYNQNYVRFFSGMHTITLENLTWSNLFDNHFLKKMWRNFDCKFGADIFVYICSPPCCTLTIDYSTMILIGFKYSLL